jgi:hypothetical protein
MKSKSILSILKASSFLIFLGRAYQHLFWDAPFRVLLWDEKLMKPVLQSVFKIDWSIYVNSIVIDSTIQNTIRFQGIVYLLAAIISIIIKPNSKKWMFIVLYTGGFSLLLLAFLLFKDRSYQLAMFFEHSIQFGTVFTLLYILKTPRIKRVIFYFKILISLTFISHGIYALGVLYPLPSYFVTMVLTLIPVHESKVIDLLFAMGLIDILIAVLIFVPRITKWVLIYAFVWGILTALARIATGLQYDVSLSIVHQYLFESIYRLPHGLIPLTLYLLLKKNNRNNLKPIS